MKMAYVRKLPTLGVRAGQVASTLGLTVTLSNYQAGSLDSSDFFCVVDKNGVIKQAGLEMQSVTALGVITTNSITGITAGDYVISGKYATSHCQLPDECEKYLIIALERLIQYRQSSSDISVSQLFSSEELETIKEVFADNSYDDAKPPVTEWQEWLP